MFLLLLLFAVGTLLSAYLQANPPADPNDAGPVVIAVMARALQLATIVNLVINRVAKDWMSLGGKKLLGLAIALGVVIDLLIILIGQGAAGFSLQRIGMALVAGVVAGVGSKAIADNQTDVDIKTNRVEKLPCLIFATVLFVSSCGPSLATGFKLGFASSKPVVQSLVPNVISQEKADLAVKDIGDGVDSAVRCENCLKAINVEGNLKRVAKAQCYFALAQDLRAILKRHNIGGSPTLDTIAGIAEAAIEALEEYYTAVITPPGSGSDGGVRSTGADASSEGDPDKQLENKLRDLDRQLKELTKGQ